MKNKKMGLSVGMILAAIGVVLLGVDKLFVSANSVTSLNGSFSSFTAIALGILFIAGIILYITTIKSNN